MSLTGNTIALHWIPANIPVMIRAVLSYFGHSTILVTLLWIAVTSRLFAGFWNGPLIPCLKGARSAQLHG